MNFYKILNLLLCLLLKTCRHTRNAHTHTVCFWGLRGHFAVQCANCSFCPRQFLGWCLGLLHLCLYILWITQSPAACPFSFFQDWASRSLTEVQVTHISYSQELTLVRICLPPIFWCKIIGNIFPQLRIIICKSELKK